jgi:hypothetical protein
MESQGRSPQRCDVTAQKEYGVTRDFILKASKLVSLNFEREWYGATPTSESLEASLNGT